MMKMDWVGFRKGGKLGWDRLWYDKGQVIVRSDLIHPPNTISDYLWLRSVKRCQTGKYSNIL
jgi:hypothetical protein